MNYKLFRLYLGTGKLETILEFSSLFKIINFCYVDRFGFILLFKNQHCLGLINKESKYIFPWVGQPDKKGHYNSTSPFFEFPSSVCYCMATHNVYVVENGGSRIRKLELNPFYASSVFGNAVEKKMLNYFSNFSDKKDIVTSCCVGGLGDIYWSVIELHRSLRYTNN